MKKDKSEPIKEETKASSAEKLGDPLGEILRETRRWIRGNETTH